ncbi:hypothetical protein [Enterococcus faecalis]|uniref:hypothetical protein n=1 Tax=Enterococcus faecalis TaxID=1351 RepID=UPI004041C3A7
MTQAKTSQELFRQIYEDFSLIIREYCFFDDISPNEIQFFGEFAAAVHRLPSENLQSEDGQLAIQSYLKFLEETIRQEQMIQPVFIAKFNDQINALREFLAQQK